MRNLNLGHALAAISRRIAHRFKYTWELVNRKTLERRTISKSEFIHDLKTAIETKTGYAAGKTGLSQQHWMYYEMLRRRNVNGERLARFERALTPHALKTGVFPHEPSFYLEFNDFYMKHLRNLDCLGIFYNRWDLEIIKYYQLKNKLIFYIEQEPDRSIPNRQENCYLQYFRSKRILIICPFSDVLRQRATKEIFEGVWSNTGKKWFYPENVDYLEFPYGFSADTQHKFPTVLDLFRHITTEIEKRQFDIALVAAGALAIPIASYVKTMGKVGIDLGGHLQVLFGVRGERWRRREDWKAYFNEYWIDMPTRYRPREVDAGLRDSSYW